MEGLTGKCGDCFTHKKSGMELMVLASDGDIFLVTCQIRIDGFVLQCPFIPVHNDQLWEFIEESIPTGMGKPIEVEYYTKFWINACGGHKSYFTIPIHDIMKEIVKQSKLDLYNLKEDSLLPLLFPGSSDNDGADKHINFDKMIGNTKINSELN